MTSDHQHGGSDQPERGIGSPSYDVSSLDEELCLDIALSGDDWVILAEREGYGRVDSWDEYFAISRHMESYCFCVVRDQWLGEVPDDWFDEDGELLPEHQHENGDLKLPDEIDGCAVLGYKYGGFTGELSAEGWEPVMVPHLTPLRVRDALSQLQWREGDFGEVWEALKVLARRSEEST